MIKNCFARFITYFCPYNFNKMKIDKSLIGSFILLLLIASLYRIIPGRPLGFAPQIAMALFSGSIVKDKKFSFILPLLSMLLSDVLYEVLFQMKVAAIPGFYSGQWVNYLLFAAVTVIGFAINSNKPSTILGGSLAGVLFFFLASNFAVWIGGGLGLNNLPYSKSIEGLTACMAAGVPFLKGSLYATLFFSAVLFGGYYLFNKSLVGKTAIQ